MNNLIMQLGAVVSAAIEAAAAAAIQNPSQTVTSSATMSSNPSPASSNVSGIVGAPPSTLRQHKTEGFPMLPVTITTSSSMMGTTHVQVQAVTHAVQNISSRINQSVNGNRVQS